MSDSHPITPASDPVRAGNPVAARAAESGPTTRESVVTREKERFGGMKFGSAFFGWLTATGTAVILIALVASIGTAIGLGNGASAEDLADDAGTISIIGGIVLTVVLLVSYLCGGYVAGRMARFDGVKQGVAVWLWALVIAIVLAILGLIAGAQFDMLDRLGSVPQIPLDGSAVTAGGVISALIALVVSLVGAILGGLAGMRFHRRVDRAGLGR